MNLDELTTVWKSQDAAPLHDMNKTLLHLALRQDEAKLQKQRRLGRWMIYVFCGAAVVGMGLFLSVISYHLLHRPDGNGLTVWDLALPIVGAAAAVISVRALYANQRTQSLREQHFGESLRDQLDRSIARLDNDESTARRTSVLVLALAGGICPAAILLLIWRINQKSISEDGYMLVTLLLLCAWAVWSGLGNLRRAVQEDTLPRKRRLEALLKELDSQP
ncbi:MAG: hypothetical protein QM760_06855 [Nibricoccus sp.]